MHLCSSEALMLHSLSTIVSAMNDVADIVRNDNYNVIVNK